MRVAKQAPQQNQHDHPNDQFDALVTHTVDDTIATLASKVGPTEVEDLAQIAHLALLEACTEAPHLDPVHDRSYLEWRMRQAMADHVGYSPETAGGPKMLSLVDVPGGDDVWDRDVSEEVVARAAASEQVHGLLRNMPGDTAEVVSLVFGLDGGVPIDPADVADILDLTPDDVDGHLWVAERLFRHHSDDPRDRRDHPLAEREFQAFRTAGDLAWYDLRDVNLNNADLSRCNLSQAVLTGMNLWGLKLVEARADGINLWGSQLEGADLQRADLRLAYLERAGLRGADFSYADLEGANLWRADLASVHGAHARLPGADLRAANLYGADLTGADLTGADLRGADLRRARLAGVDLSQANLEGAQLWRTDLRWADLEEANLCWLDLSLADLRGACLQGATRSPKLDIAHLRRAPAPQRLRPLAASA